MDELATRIAATSDEFRANQAAMQSLVDQLREAEAKARAGGGAKSHERHRAQGKLPVRERLDRVLDPGSPFLELSPLAAWGMYDDDAPGAGIVTGIGRVSGREVLIVANDATVKGGTYYPITVRSTCGHRRWRWPTGCPCLYLVDSGGAFLPLQAEVFPDRDHFGRIFYQPGAHVRGTASRRSPS